MKKTFCMVITLLVIVGSVLLSQIMTVSAGFTPTNPTASPSNGTGYTEVIAANAWKTGAEVEVDLTANPASPWLQLLTKGVVVSKPTKICHEFRGGQYHWNGEIRMLKDGKWVKVPTVNDWVPNNEGLFMSCADVTQSGTYALFGYYDGPTEPQPTATPNLR